MKNYGRDPDTDVREMVKAEIEACEFAASESDSRADDSQIEADRHRANAAKFRAASLNLRSQLVALESVLGEVA